MKVRIISLILFSVYLFSGTAFSSSQGEIKQVKKAAGCEKFEKKPLFSDKKMDPIKKLSKKHKFLKKR